jgi:hypothetical protein
MKRLILTASLSLFATVCFVSAAPLQPMNTSIDILVNGTVNIGGNFPPQNANYSQQGHSTGFTSAGTQLSASVTAGNVPGCPHSGTAGSSGGVTFEQVAFNEYVLTLSSTALGQLLKTEAPGFDFGNVNGYSSLHVQSDFLILGQEGATSTILLELEHFGTLSSVNNGNAHNSAHVDVHSGPGDNFVYHSDLSTPYLPLEFERNEFTGTRNITRTGSISTYVGETINLFAEFDSDVFAGLAGQDNFNYISAASNFDSGIRLHMTVVPEPATICLLAFGGFALLRRKNQK